MSSSSPVRRLSLHPSALSDAEHALFTASLADLAEGTGGLDQVSVSMREARAWICGRYAALGSGTVDEILRLFSPASTLGSGAFFAALRLVLHAQAGRGVDRSLAFVQAPVPAAPIPLGGNSPVNNPFLPTPAPSPEARARPPLPPRKPTSPSFNTPNKLVGHSARNATSSSESSVSTSSSSLSLSSRPARRTSHGYSSSLSGSPPTHPLRRASTQRSPTSSSSSSLQTSNVSDLPPPAMQRTISNGGAPRAAQNPFRPTPLPRRASTSVPTSPFSSPPNSVFRAPANFQANVHPATPTEDYPHLPPTSPFDAPRRTYPKSAGPGTSSFALAPHPPVHPQRRATASSFEAAYGADSLSLTSPNARSPSAHDARRGSSDSRRVSSDSTRRSDATRDRDRTPSASGGAQGEAWGPL